MSETPKKEFVPDKPIVSRKFWMALWFTCAIFQIVIKNYEII